jgi:hypothetical protein
MYSLFLSGDRPVIYCVAGWTGAGTLRTAAFRMPVDLVNSSIGKGAVADQLSPIDRAKTWTTTEEHLADQLAEKTEKDETPPGISIICPAPATFCPGLDYDFRGREFWTI